ncbi:MAG: DeoR/GlpR family DNA-binding transcription regulator [Bauldia sp.]
MHEWERWQLILRQVRARGFLRVRELLAATEASPATLRRDLAKLEGMGQIRRVHGGIQGVDATAPAQIASRSIDVRQALNADRKRLVAKAAADLCHDGESIIINAGSTTGFMAEYLRHANLQILTNSFPIAHELIATSANRIVLPGGEVYRDQGIILSPFEEDAIQSFTASKMFMSCYAITAMGIVEDDPLVARAETKLLSRAETLIVIADATKFDARGSMIVCPLGRVHTLITDASAPEPFLDQIRSEGVRVLVVGDERAASRTAA